MRFTIKPATALDNWVKMAIGTHKETIEIHDTVFRVYGTWLSIEIKPCHLSAIHRILQLTIVDIILVYNIGSSHGGLEFGVHFSSPFFIKKIHKKHRCCCLMVWLELPNFYAYKILSFLIGKAIIVILYGFTIFSQLRNLGNCNRCVSFP